MKKIIIAALFAPLAALAQTYPSPTFNSITLQNPLTPANGGTGVANSGTITLGGSFSTTGGNPLVLNTTAPTNITLPTSGTLLNSSSGATAGANSNITSLSGLTTPLSVSQGGTGSSTATGSGSAVLATSPTLVTPNLGTPSAATLTNATGLPVSTGISGLGTGVAAALANAVTGSGSPVLATSPTLSNAIVGTQSAGNNSTLAASTGFVAAHAPCPSILDYGGNNGGVVSNNAAWTNAVAAQSTGNVCVFFPQGTYYFASSIGYTFPNTNPNSITIKGVAADSSILKFNATSFGISIAANGPFSGIHIRDLSVTTTASTPTGVAINLAQQQSTIANPANSALSDITNVTTRGADGYVVTDGWSNGVNVASVSNINFTNLTTIGPSTASYGVILNGTSTALGVVYNFQGCTFNYLGIGLYYAAYVQGVTVNQSNFTGDTNGIVVPTGQAGLDQLSVTNSQFNTYNNGILTQSNVGVIMIANNFFLVQNNSNGISLQNYSAFSIIGNTFNPAVASPTGTRGIYIDTWASSAGVITANAIQEMTTGILLGSGSKSVNVQSNVYFANTTNISNSGTGNTLGGGSQ
jgi:hypothetical protein